MLRFPGYSHAYRREASNAYVSLWSVQKITTDSSGWQTPSRMPQRYILLFADCGELICALNQTEITLRAGELVCVIAGTRFALRSADNKKSSFYLAEFEGEGIDFLQFEKGYCLARMPGSSRGNIVSMYSAACTPRQSPPTADCYLLLILDELAKNASFASAGELYRRVCEYVMENALRDLTAEDVALHIGYNKDHICRAVRSYSGKTLKELICGERINAAVGLLASTNYSVSKIADILSFPTPNSFIKYFKYHTSVTPTEYRKRR